MFTDVDKSCSLPRGLDARGVPEEPRLPGAPELPLRAREVQAGRALREHRVDLCGNLHCKYYQILQMMNRHKI